MKQYLWLACGFVLCGSVVAQQTADSPPSVAATDDSGAGTGNSPGVSPTAAAGSATATKPASAAATALRTTPLVPGSAKVVARNVNVRGQPRLMSEVITRLNWGDEVMVLDEIKLEDSGPNEPSAWAKVLLPTNSHVWVHSMFVDESTHTVTANLLNLRGGPGENYSILGQSPRGYLIQGTQVKGDWIEIEAPTNAYAFMAAQYLEQGQAAQQSAVVAQATPQTTPEESTAAPPSTTEPPPATTNVVSEAPPIISAPVDATPTTPPTNATAVASTGPSTNTTAAAGEPVSEQKPEEPPPPRIVQHEGVVRGTASIQAPTKFELFSPESGRVINYLYTNARDLDLGRYKGLRIIVTGEEGLDERWRNTPVLTIQRIQVLE